MLDLKTQKNTNNWSFIFSLLSKAMIPLSNQHIKNAEHNLTYVTVLCHFSQVVFRHYKGVTSQNLKIVPSFGVSCLNLMRKLRKQKDFGKNLSSYTSVHLFHLQLLPGNQNNNPNMKLQTRNRNPRPSKHNHKQIQLRSTLSPFN